ncbi:MAG: hypothetical protein ACE5H1_05335 [Thermodesulfobacteriota bacterium]
MKIQKIIPKSMRSLSSEVKIRLSFIKFIKSLKNWQWGEAYHYGEFYEWKYKQYKLIYNSKDDSFYVKPPNFNIILNSRYIFDNTRWKAKTLKRIVLNSVALPIIRHKAKEAFLKELPERRRWREFVIHLKKTYPKAYENFSQWMRMQSCIYRGYGHHGIWLKDFMELAGIEFDSENSSYESIEDVFKQFEERNAYVVPKIKDIKFAKECPHQFTKEALKTIEG